MGKQPQQPPQNSMMGKTLEIDPMLAAQNIRNFVAGVSGQGMTGDTFWILMESLRSLEEGCRAAHKKPAPKPKGDKKPAAT